MFDQLVVKDDVVCLNKPFFQGPCGWGEINYFSFRKIRLLRITLFAYILIPESRGVPNVIPNFRITQIAMVATRQ